MNQTNGQVAAATFFTQLDEGIQETPQEKERRIEDERHISHKKRQEKLMQIKANAGKTLEVPITIIDVSENIRAVIDEKTEGFRSLIENIRSTGGVFQPPVVAVLKRGNDLRLVCLAGHRRILASKRAGEQSILVLVRDIEEESDHLMLSISENLVREDLHPLDIARTFSRLNELGETAERLSYRVGKSAKTVQQYMKMQNEWPDRAHKLIRSHPEKFTARSLLVLARKRLTEEELMQRLELVINGASKKISPRIERRRAVEDFLEKKSISQRDKDLVLSIIDELKLI